MSLLILSNGHGEDEVASLIVQAMQRLPHPPVINALPIVGTGQAYHRPKIEIVGPVQAMPSGGFVYMDLRQLLGDLGGGLLSLTWRQLQVIRTQVLKGSRILAVGDIVPLLFAWWSGAPYAFVGTAKSDYYLRDLDGPYPELAWSQRWQSSVYLPWERLLMQHPRCRAVFPRDHLTSERLRQWPIPVFDFGNPMMDQLDPQGHLPLQQLGVKSALTVLLLPGSRPPEVYANWALILSAIADMLLTITPASLRKRDLLFLAAITPSLDLQAFHPTLKHHGWRWQSEESTVKEVIIQTFMQKQATLLLAQRGFNDCLHAADIVIAMAGTATEQCVGLGKPVVTLPGRGPQFTAKFARAQARFLGPSITMVDRPDQVPAAVQHLAMQSEQKQEWQLNGDRRMGKPGAAQQIAACLQQQLLSEQSVPS